MLASTYTVYLATLMRCKFVKFPLSPFSLNSYTKCSRGTCFRNLLGMHYDKLNRGSYIESVTLNGFNLMIWPKFA